MRRVGETTSAKSNLSAESYLVLCIRRIPRSPAIYPKLPLAPAKLYDLPPIKPSEDRHANQGLMKILHRATALAFLTLLTCLAPRPASARTLRIENFDAQITVNTDGTLDVTEKITVNFSGAWNGIYRTIPVEYTTDQHLGYSLILDSVTATGDSGSSLRTQITRQGVNEQIKIWVPGAVDTSRRVTLHYRVLDGLKFFNDHDELYWNITGNEWEEPIDSAGAEIELPSGTTNIRTLAFTGAYGSRSQDADIRVEGDRIEVHTRHGLAFHEGLTAVIGWDKGFVHEPSAFENFMLMVRSNAILFLPFIAFAVMFWLWWNFGRDPKRLAISVQYEPPDGLSPAEVGTLVDDEAAMRDITATLVDLAVKGYLVIEQVDTTQMLGLLHHKEYIFHLKRPATEWTSAKPHEIAMLNALFDSGERDSVKLSELQNHFYASLPGIRDRIFDALITDGYYLHRPDTVRQGYIAAGVVIGVLIFAGGRLLGGNYGVTQVTAFVSGLLTAAVICGFGWFMPARTVRGARTFEKVLGFEDFLGRVEGDRIERIEKTPEMFEKFLPYAMALRVEKKWVQAFSNIAMQPPQWFQGGYGAAFYPYLLVNDLNAMSIQAGSTMASSPRSAGGSGLSGGGGFSGGGFGGGGGGGF